MKIIFSIISCKNYINTRQAVLKKTWLNGIDYFFSSDCNTKDNVCFSNLQGHRSAEEKQLKAIRYAWETYRKYDWFFFCDDDTYINIYNLNTYINGIDASNNSFGLVFSKELYPLNPIWPYVEKNFQYYSGGAGFAIRNDLMEKIYNKNFDINTGYSDISVGYLLKGENLNNCHLLNQDNPYHLNHNYDTIKLSISYHYMNDDMINELYNKIN